MNPDNNIPQPTEGIWQKYKKIVVGLAIVLTVAAVPLTVFLTQQQQDIRQRAAAVTSLSFTPPTTQTAPLVKTVNDTFTVDIMVNPGNNKVSFVKFEVTYDPTKITLDTNPYEQNTSNFPVKLQGPTYTNGKISGSVSVGSDFSKVITTPSRVATIRFKALQPTNSSITQVTYTVNSQVLSTDTNDQATENVLTSTTPAFIKINSAPVACTFTPSPADVMLIVDLSGSTSDNRQSQKNAMIGFVNSLAARNNQYKIGLVSFAGRAVLNTPLQNGSDYNSLKATIQNIPSIDNASAGEAAAIKIASDQLKASGRPGVRKVIVLLTDRHSSHDNDAAMADYALNKTAYYVVAYDINNSTVRRTFQKLASDTGGTYREFQKNQAATLSEESILTSTADDISCPTVTPQLTIQPSPTPTNKPTPTPTKVPTPIATKIPTPTTKPATPVPTRVPTAIPTKAPTNTPVPPTATPIPQATKFTFDLLLHGIGHVGDSVNPTAFSMSNQNPIRQQRNLIVEVLSTGDNPQKIMTKTIPNALQYNKTSGNYTATIDMGITLKSGIYNINIHSDQYLYESFAGIQVNAGQTKAFPQKQLITGDVNNDDTLNILDYDILIGCYSDFSPPVDCPNEIIPKTSFTLKAASDITDDGLVNQFDYNLFLREYSQQGSRRIQ